MALLPNLTSYWRMEEASGSRADAVGTNTLTDNNTVTQQAGKIGFAGSYTAANSESLSRASNATLTTGGVDFSLAYWVNPVDLAGNYMQICKLDSGNNGEWDLLQLIGGAIRVRLWVAAAAQANFNSGTSLTAAIYNLVVFTFVNSTRVASISVNNSVFTTAVATAAPVDTAVPFTIGILSGDGAAFSGGIDEVGWWKGRALSIADVGLLWNAGAGNGFPFGEVTMGKSGFRNAMRIGL